MLHFLFVFCVTLGLAQLGSTYNQWRTMSLVGENRAWGVIVSAGLILFGLWGLFDAPLLPTFIWPLFTVPLSLILLLTAGSYIRPPEHPDILFSKTHPEHSGCESVSIPNGDETIPGLLLFPHAEIRLNSAVCVVHGSGDNKKNFKWRLIHALLAQGFTVLTIDMPGHGDYVETPFQYPECLRIIPTAIRYLQARLGDEAIGLLGISLGAAVSLRSLVNVSGLNVGALALIEMPLQVEFNQRLFYKEAWQAFNAPVLSLYRDISLRQMRESWKQGAIRSKHSTTETFDLLDPESAICQLEPGLPLLLVYSQHDPIALLAHGQKLKKSAPQAELVVIKKASHVTLTLMPAVVDQIAVWLYKNLAHT
ncbi:MAG: alpha/beta fold hydrolase [Chloroflexota bacterium]